MNGEETVKSFMDVYDVPNSLIANNALNPTNNLESNRKTVNNIYINSWLNGILTFSPADSATLYNIATQNPLVGGDAVYSARVLLNLFPDDQLYNNQRMMEEENSVVENSGRIYPNPAKDEAYLDYPLNDGETGVFEIYSIVGDKVASYVLKPNEPVKFSTLQMNPGIYVCKVTVNGQQVYTEKFVVIK